MNHAVSTTGRAERALIEAYAAGTISREAMIDGLAAIAVPARSDPTGGEGYQRGTRDAIERATREGLLIKDDWVAIVNRSQDCPALLAIE